jgi:glutamate-1-semialdehyde 2,1-aminomutase
MNTTQSAELFERARGVIPGGVNSPVRAFRAVGGNPLFIARASGSRLWDVDGNEFIDYIGSWGPMILGHAHPEVLAAVEEAARSGTSFGAPTEREVLMAELIRRMVPSVEVVRMVNSGTEATMSAVRLARAFTKRDLLIKFEGCYHGHGDAFLIKAGSGAMTLSVPDSPGVPPAVAAGTLTAEYNNLASVRALLETNRGAVAAVIVEPVVGNMGCVPPEAGFLSGLRELCTQHGALLIFDEVMTGFRLARGGAQELYGIAPDLTTLGKIIGGGLPVGAYGGRREIMELVAPSGPVYQAGTLSGNPLAMSAGLATLGALDRDPGLYARLEASCQALERAVRDVIERLGQPLTLNRVGSMMTLFFAAPPVTNYATAAASDTRRFGRFFQALLREGIYFPPSQFEAAFVSLAHSEEDLSRTASAITRALEVAVR